MTPLIFDIAAGLEAADLVGAGAERRLERQFLERLSRVVGPRKNRQAGDEERHVAGAFRRESDIDDYVVLRLRVDKIAQQLGDDRMPLGLEEVEREGDVMRGEPRAVVEPGRGPDEEPVAKAVGGAPHLLGGKPVHRVRLVAGADHERGEGEVHPLRRVALEDVAVQRIEGEEVLIVFAVRPDLRERAALRRLRIDVAEVMEVRRIGKLAERRETVRFDLVVGASGQYPTNAAKRRGACERERPTT